MAAGAGRMAERLGSPFGPISPAPIKHLLFQILKGVCNWHSQKVLHLDLKPHNLLLDRQTSCLNVADFGLAGTFDGAPSEYSYEVGTLAYKAPKLILEMRQTTTAADIWPVGCISAEMVNGSPPFDMKIDVYLMRNIISILRVPTEIERPGATSALREFCANGALQLSYFKTLLQNTQLLDVFYTPRLFFEWMDKDIAKLIEFGPISTSPVKHLLFKILKGVCNWHSQKVLHRDLKPHNLLLDLQTSCLKVSDFGLARTFDGAPSEYSYEVGTLAYKAPTLILEMRQTTTAADIWPVGCIFAEMVNGSPPFDMKIDVYLMRNIISILGVPTEIERPGATSALRELSANGALQHPYFKTLLQSTQLLDVFYTPQLSFEWMDKHIAKLIEFGLISSALIKHLLLQILGGVYCHSQKVLHGCLKPHNLLLDEHQTSSLKLADFGLAETFNGAPAEYSDEKMLCFVSGKRISAHGGLKIFSRAYRGRIKGRWVHKKASNSKKNKRGRKKWVLKRRKKNKKGGKNKNRKNTNVDDLTCEGCKRTLKSKSDLSRHQESCLLYRMG